MSKYQMICKRIGQLTVVAALAGALAVGAFAENKKASTQSPHKVEQLNPQPLPPKPLPQRKSPNAGTAPAQSPRKGYSALSQHKGGKL